MYLFSVLLLTILIYNVRSEEMPCEHFVYTTDDCLDYNITTVYCFSMQNCPSIPICPYAVSTNDCYEDSYCPSAPNLLYRVLYNRTNIETPDSPEDSSISYEDSSGQTTEYYDIEENSVCYYDMVDYISNQQNFSKTKLKFDSLRGSVMLKTRTIGENEFIKCYLKNQEEMFEVQVEEVYSLRMRKRNRTNLQFYELEIEDDPNVYFCTIGENDKPPRIITKEIVGYADTSYTKYIVTMPATEENLSQDLCLNENIAGAFAKCTLITITDEMIFYFIRDKYSRSAASIDNFLRSSAQYSIGYVRNVEYCLANATETTNGVLHWNMTVIGTTTTPLELCLDATGRQITRKCSGDFFTGAYWSKPSGECSETVTIPDRTYRIHRLVLETTAITTVFTNITNETDNFLEFTPVDVNLLSEGLRMMSMQRNLRNYKSNFLHSVNNLMRINESILRDSQEQLNSTDKILDSIDTFIGSCANDIVNISTTIESNILTQISYPFVSNVIGIALYNRNKSNDFLNYEIVDIHLDQTFEILSFDDLELAVYVPTELIHNLTSHLTQEEKTTFKIINTIFYNDSLFNEIDAENRSAGSRIVNVKMPGFDDNFNIPIPLLFRPVLNFTDPSCVYWDYGLQKLGEWSSSGGQYMGLYNNGSLMQCSFTHVTHFALLVLSENIIIIEQEDGVIIIINPLDAHDLPLTLLTLIGCGLSICGILGILFTTILFKDWYKKRLNSIQLSIIMLIEIIVLFVADLDTLEDGPACTAIGAVLHYVVLSKFTWMLLIARLQYLKFVKIFENVQKKSHVFLHVLVGWLIPVIPVVLSLIFFPTNYNAGNLNFCYAKGHALYFFMILPACIIILFNIGVFALIMINVARSKAQDFGVNIQKLQIRLAIMLLFMLGITWIFGLIGEIVPWSWFKLTCLYIFCILGPIQGFVMFTFNVLLDKPTMDLWADMFKITPKTKPYERSTRSEVVFTSDTENVTVNYFGKRD